MFNVGAGFIVQPQAVWYRSSATSPDTLAYTQLGDKLKDNLVGSSTFMP